MMTQQKKKNLLNTAYFMASFIIALGIVIQYVNKGEFENRSETSRDVVDQGAITPSLNNSVDITNGEVKSGDITINNNPVIENRSNVESKPRVETQSDASNQTERKQSYRRPFKASNEPAEIPQYLQPGSSNAIVHETFNPVPRLKELEQVALPQQAFMLSKTPEVNEVERETSIIDAPNSIILENGGSNNTFCSGTNRVNACGSENVESNEVNQSIGDNNTGISQSSGSGNETTIQITSPTD